MKKTSLKSFKSPLSLMAEWNSSDIKSFCKEYANFFEVFDNYYRILCRCQEVLLDSMEVGPNIARNAALRENVFMMAICINLRIPLFVVGKPGSSKSLAKTIVSDSMHGDGANSKLLKEFKQVSCVTVS